MEWVTFHWSILNGVQDVETHKNRDEAVKHFRRHYKSYFQLAPSLPRKLELPFQVGFPHRKYIVMTKRMFNKTYGKKRG